MAVKITSFRTAAKSVKKFAKKVAQAYTTSSEGRVRSDSGGTSPNKCEAICILVSEDGYKEPVCLDHPAKEMEMERLMRGEIEKVGVTGYTRDGGTVGGLRGGCLCESETEDSGDDSDEKTSSETHEGYANLNFDVVSLGEELTIDEMKRTGGLCLAFEDADDEKHDGWKKVDQKMRENPVNRVDKWSNKVEALDDDKMEEESTYSGDAASVFTVETFVTEITYFSEKKRAVETWGWVRKNEVC